MCKSEFFLSFFADVVLRWFDFFFGGEGIGLWGVMEWRGGRGRCEEEVRVIRSRANEAWV